MSNEDSKVGALAFDAQVLAIIAFAKSHDLELRRIIFVQEGDGDTHQTRVVHGDVLGAVHIDSSAVIIGGVVVLISLIGFYQG